MRLSTWHRSVDIIRQRYGGDTLSADFKEGVSADVCEVEILALLDSRVVKPHSFSLACINNPLLEDVDGCVFVQDGQEYFVSAATLHPAFADDLIIHCRKPQICQAPDNVQRWIYRAERWVMKNTTRHTLEDYWREVWQIARRIDRVWSSTYVYSEMASVRMMAEQLMSVEFDLSQLAFTEICQLAARASHAAKRLPPTPKAQDMKKRLYSLKAWCLNWLVENWHETDSSLYRVTLSNSTFGPCVIAHLQTTFLGEEESFRILERHHRPERWSEITRRAFLKAVPELLEGGSQ
jgi:hypothetical protein